MCIYNNMSDSDYDRERFADKKLEVVLRNPQLNSDIVGTIL